jgi:hypothetical protein
MSSSGGFGGLLKSIFHKNNNARLRDRLVKEGRIRDGEPQTGKAKANSDRLHKVAVRKGILNA